MAWVRDTGVYRAGFRTLGCFIGTNTLGAFIGVDDVDGFPFADGVIGALRFTGSATDALIRILRNYRRKAMVRIAWRDLRGSADLTQTVAELSALADTCLEQTLNLLYQWQCESLGVPRSADGSRQNLVIIGVGKLGARELNFSSDVDLIFAYPQDGETRGAEKSLSNADFFTRL